MVYQARFLITHGLTEVLTTARRQFLYGDDIYIARRIANYLSRENQLRSKENQAYFNDLLEQISGNANLRGIDAIERLLGSDLLLGYEYLPDLNINEWRED